MIKVIKRMALNEKSRTLDQIGYWLWDESGIKYLQLHDDLETKQLAKDASNMKTHDRERC